jgi:hypothetical protein
VDLAINNDKRRTTMATVTKVNPTSTTLNYEVVGAEINFFTVDYINAINGSVGPAGAHQLVLNTIQNTKTIVAAGPLADTNTQQTFAVEGDLTATEASALQVAIRALGAAAGDVAVDLSAATVTRTKLGILTAAAIA